jgi:predicted DNA-binding ribbon-helix-helix protein
MTKPPLPHGVRRLPGPRRNAARPPHSWRLQDALDEIGRRQETRTLRLDGEIRPLALPPIAWRTLETLAVDEGTSVEELVEEIGALNPDEELGAAVQLHLASRLRARLARR